MDDESDASGKGRTVERQLIYRSLAEFDGVPGRLPAVLVENGLASVR